MSKLTITLCPIPPNADESAISSYRSAIYYARRYELLRRGVKFMRASVRATRLSVYLVARGQRGVS